MTTPADHPSIDRYLTRARALWEQQDLPPSQEQLRELAKAVDMSDDASEAADEEAHALTRQAQQAASDKDGDQVQTLLRDAVLLSPVRLQPHYLLAKHYAERYAESGDHDDRAVALELANRAQQLDPEHAPTRNVIENLGKVPQDSLPWKKAALIVLVIVAISGSLQLCHRYYVAPEVTDEQTEEVRRYLEEHGEPPR